MDVGAFCSSISCWYRPVRSRSSRYLLACLRGYGLLLLAHQVRPPHTPLRRPPSASLCSVRAFMCVLACMRLRMHGASSLKGRRRRRVLDQIGP